jgi:hypothetical protein
MIDPEYRQQLDDTPGLYHILIHSTFTKKKDILQKKDVFYGGAGGI